MPYYLKKMREQGHDCERHGARFCCKKLAKRVSLPASNPVAGETVTSTWLIHSSASRVFSPTPQWFFMVANAMTQYS